MIDEFAKEANLEKSLVLKLRHALRYSTERSGFTWNDKQAVFNELPKSLRYQVAIAMHHGAAKFLSFFQDKDMVLISAIIPFLNPNYVKSEESVYKLNEYADEVYFVVKGRLALLHGTEGIHLKALQRGEHFGDIETIQKFSRKYPVKAIRESELLIMNKSLLQLIMYEFPSVWENMLLEARQKDETFEKLGIEAKLLRKLKLSGKLEVLTPFEIKETIEMKCNKRSIARQNSINREPNLNDIMSYLADLKSHLVTLENTTAELSRAFNEFQASSSKRESKISTE